MNRILCTLAALAAFIAPAAGGLTQAELGSVAYAVPPGTRIPENLILFDAASGHAMRIVEALAGRPALLIPVDFTCHSVCGPALTIASAALTQTGLRPGQDFKLLVLGFDPRDSAAEARAFTRARVQPAIAAATRILQADSTSMEQMLTALAYRAAYDAPTDQFAHPAAALVATADGRIARALSSLALNPHDLKLALVEAGKGQIGSIADRVTLLCSRFDPVQGIYTGAISRLLQAACGFTVLLVAGMLLLLCRYTRREGAA